MTSRLISPEHESQARALAALLRDQVSCAKVNLVSVHACMYPKSKARDTADHTERMWADVNKSLSDLADRIVCAYSK